MGIMGLAKEIILKELIDIKASTKLNDLNKFNKRCMVASLNYIDSQKLIKIRKNEQRNRREPVRRHDPQQTATQKKLTVGFADSRHHVAADDEEDIHPE